MDSFLNRAGSPRRLALAAILVLAFALGLPAAQPAQAIGPIVVNNLSGLDANDGMSGTCTLYEAIQSANSDSAYGGCSAGQSLVPDLITFGLPGVITVQSTLNVNTSIALLGPIALSGGNATRIFRLGSSSSNLSLSTMTLQDGSSAGGGAIEVASADAVLNIAGVSFQNNHGTSNGGAINSVGTLHIVAANFVGNKSDADGGAIWSGGSGTSLTLAASNFNGNKASGDGGAIYNSNSQSSSEISDVLFAGNIATGDSSHGGGAIANGSNGKLAIIRSSFDGNLSPSGFGGAIFNKSSATLAISDSSLNGNLAGTPPSTTRAGGAIANWGTLTATGSTFLNNAVVGDGGAIGNDKAGVATLANTSFTANAATGSGGGLNNINSNNGSSVSTVTIKNVTFSSNAAIQNGGGGIFNGPNQTITLGNTIVDNSDGAGANCAGTLVSLGHNLDGGASCGFSAAGDKSNGSANLAIPFFNGGPIVSLLTQKLNYPSDALDQGDPAICADPLVANLDQRGKSRPKDGDGNGTPICDIGAFEGEDLAAGYGSTPVQPGPIAFGNSVINPVTPLVASLDIFETGNKDLVVSNPQFSGANPGDFTVKAPSPFPITIADGAAAKTVQLTCAPTAVGARSATLALSTNDFNHPTVSYTLLCSGTPTPVPGYGSAPVAPGPIDFGSVNVGASGIVSLQVQETGSAPLHVSNPQLGGANPGDFAVKAPSPFPITIADGAAAQSVQLTCTPSAYDIRSATLTLSTDDPAKPTVGYNLSCEGVQPPSPTLDTPGASLPYPLPASPANGPYGVATSPDGKNVYAADNGNNRLIVFTRDPINGNISVKQTVINGTGGVSGLDGPYLVTVSPDGQNVYATGSNVDSVVSFKRSAIDGTLTFLSKVSKGDQYGFCLPSCPFTLDALDGAYQVLISPDGQYGYVSSINDNKVLVLYRSSATGALALDPLSGPVQVYGLNPADLTKLSAAYGLAIAPDGLNMYLAGYSSDTLLVLKRNAADGTLAAAPVEIKKNGQAGVSGLNGVFRVTVSPDGAYVYTASFDDSAITAFQRDQSTGKLAYLTTYKNGVGGIAGLSAATSVTISPDGGHLFATGYFSKAVAVFDRDITSGLLTQTQVIIRAPFSGAGGVPALDGARDVASSPDGQTIYATGYVDNQVVALHIANPIPLLRSLQPSSKTAGGPAFTLNVTGKNFVPGAIVKWAGSSRTTSFVNSTQLSASILAADIASVGTANITVVNPTPGGGLSANSLPFTISAPSDNPVPSLKAISPSAANAGASAFTLTLDGSNFMASSKVRWNGAERPTTYVSDKQLLANIGMADLAQPGPVAVTVYNGGPGGGASNALMFTVSAPGKNPRPSITSLAPPSVSVVAGATGLSLVLTINGVGFIEDSQAQWNGENRPTTFADETQLKITLSAADLTAAGNNNVTVVNPGPGGGESNTATFTASAIGANPVPALLGFTFATGAGSTITVILQGANFINGSTVFWNGVAQPTAFISGQQLTISIATSLISQGGPASLTVANPGPGGGESNTLLFKPAKLYVPVLRR